MQETLAHTSGRMVVVSGSVQMLDRIQALCAASNWTAVRIDGSTAAGQRHDIVTGFNLHGMGQVRVS